MTMNKRRYLLMGDGRLARHLSHYLRSMDLEISRWSRKKDSPDAISELAKNTDRVLVAISDSALSEFVETELSAFKSKVVHFSGCLSIDGVASAHPLMTFGDELYPLETYRQIPFVVERPHHLKDLLPEIENRSFQILPQDKARYHSLCVMSGNFSMLLWRKMFEDFERHLGLPREVAIPYMKQVFENLQKDPTNLTGPLERQDRKTISANLESLRTDPYLAVYQGFVKAYEGGSKGCLQ